MAKPSLVQLQRLVGNPLVYAVQNATGSYTPVREPLTDSVLQAHLDETITVGTYIGHVADGVTVAKTLVFDSDIGGAEALEQVSAIQKALSEGLGVPAACMGIEFSGKKGYHLWLPLQEYRPSTELRRMGRAALALSSVDCEMNPKQDEVRDLGNLVKLPGGVHRVSGKANDFVDRVPMPLPMSKWHALLNELPAEVRTRRTSVQEFRFPCMAAIQEEGVREGGRNIQLFHLGSMLRRAGVTDDNVEAILRRTNDLGDPLDEYQLEQVIEGSKRSGPICEQLPAERRCGELCIKERIKGLHPFPRALTNAAEGEAVVLRVAQRTELNGVTSVYLEHDDIRKHSKAVLK